MPSPVKPAPRRATKKSNESGKEAERSQSTFSDITSSAFCSGVSSALQKQKVPPVKENQGGEGAGEGQTNLKRWRAERGTPVKEKVAGGE